MWLSLRIKPLFSVVYNTRKTIGNTDTNTQSKSIGNIIPKLFFNSICNIDANIFANTLALILRNSRIIA